MVPNSPIILNPNTNLRQATSVMEERNCSAVLVGEENLLLGIFTLTDLRKVIALDLSLTTTTLADFCTRFCTEPVVTLDISQQSDISAILQLWRSHNLSHLPLINQAGDPVGIVELDYLLTQLQVEYERQSKSQIQLAKEAANLKLATELNYIGCWHLNLITNQSVWNDIQFRLMGLLPTKDKCSYFTWRESVHPDDRMLVDREFNQAIASDRELEVRHRVILPNGKVCWHLTRGKALYDELKQPISMVGITVDITDAHNIRLALQQKEEQNQQLIGEKELLLCSERHARKLAEFANLEWEGILESITEIFISINREWIITNVNSAATSLFGFSSAQMVGHSFWQFFPDCQQNQFGRIYQIAMKTNKYQEIEDFHPAFKTWLQIRVFPSDIGLSIFGRDVSETRKLQIERDRLFEFSRTLQVITDNTGKILQVNPAWQRILGYTVEESLGRSFIDFVYRGDIERTTAHLKEQAGTAQATENFEIRYYCKDGDVIWLSWDCFSFPSEQKIYGFGKNINNLKIAEQSLQLLNNELEAIVEERTAQLEESVDRSVAMLNAIPDRLILTNTQGNCLDWSLQIGLQTANRYVCSKEHITEILALQAESAFFRAFDRAIITAEVQVYENETATSESRQYQEIRLSPCGEDEMLVLVRDISDRRVAENLIIQNEKYLKAIVQLQLLFLSLPFDRAIPTVLQILGEVTKSSRAFLFKNHRDSSDRLLTSQIGEWCAPEITSQIDNPELQNLVYDRSTQVCFENLSKGKYVNQIVSELTREERQRLEEQEIKSILEFPLQFQGEWWGILGFDQCDAPRIWVESEIELLRAAAAAINLAVERQESENSLIEATEKLHQSNKFIQRIANTVPGLLYIFDLEQQTTVYTNRDPGELLGYQKGELKARAKNTLQNLMHPEDMNVLSNHFSQSQTFEESQIYSLEYRVRNKSGEWNWFLSQDTVFSRNAEGKVTQLIGTSTNISDRKAAEQKLQNSLVEKEILLKEIHHRVKNNLNIIDGLLSLQIRSIENIELKQQLQDSRQRIAIMALVHQQLYQTEKLNQVNFAEYINSLCQNLYQACVFYSKLITMEVKLEPIMGNVDIAIPIGLILNELLTNAFKHAFPESILMEQKGNPGKVVVEFYAVKKPIEKLTERPPEESNGKPTEAQSENLGQFKTQLHLWVKDNGVGFNPSDRREDEKPASLGMELIKILTHQLRATIQIENSQVKSQGESGTSVHLILPIS